MMTKPDGKPATATDDARASDGKDADARRNDAAEAADARVDVQKRKAEPSSNAQTHSAAHEQDEASSETDLVNEALNDGSDA